MRFRRRVKLFPGVYLNFSKTGISTTVGVPGASINFSKQGSFLNTGIPGTGIYDRQKIGSGKKGQQNIPVTDTPSETYVNIETGAIKSEQAETVTSEDLQELKKTLLGVYNERSDLKKEIRQAEGRLTLAAVVMVLSYILLFGFFIKWFKDNRRNKKEYLDDLNNQLQNCFVNINMQLDEQFEKKYVDLLGKFKNLLTCEKIWDLTSSVSVDRRKTRSAAAKSVSRRAVKFGLGNIDIIKSKYDALHFENANGGDLYIYPAFVALVDDNKKFGLIDIRKLEFNFWGQKFIEEENIPKDAVIVDHTWAKVNKNGTPDKRFKGNCQIPVCQYGEMTLKSDTGLNEAYSLSSFEKSSNFAKAMLEYQKLIKVEINSFGP